MIHFQCTLPLLFIPNIITKEGLLKKVDTGRLSLRSILRGGWGGGGGWGGRWRGLQGNLKHFYNQKFLKNSYDIRGAMLKKCGF